MSARILVVDDDPWILRMVTASLRKRQFTVDTARDGRQALDRMRANIPALIITDVMMPVMDGWTFVKHLRQEPELAKIPVIFLTALSKDAAKLRSLGLTEKDYLSKPFRFEELEKRVDAALGDEPSSSPPPPPNPAGQAVPGANPGYPPPPGTTPNSGLHQIPGYPPPPGTTPNSGLHQIPGYPPPPGTTPNSGVHPMPGPYGYPQQGQYPGQYPPPQQGQYPGQYPPPPGQYPPQYGQYPPQQGQYPPQPGQYPPQQGQYPPQPGQYPGGPPVAAPPTAGTPPPTPDAPQPNQPRRGTALNGKLEQLGLSSLLVMMEMERKQGVLSLMPPEGKPLGQISIRGGRVVEASLDGEPDLPGKDCVYRMLAWTAGMFSFNATTVDVEDSVQSSTTHLLMEGARLIDEAERDTL